MEFFDREYEIQKLRSQEQAHVPEIGQQEHRICGE